MNKVILYSGEYPSRDVLKKKMAAKGIVFKENSEWPSFQNLNFVRTPVLEVDGRQMDFLEANKWIDGYLSKNAANEKGE